MNWLTALSQLPSAIGALTKAVWDGVLELRKININIYLMKENLAMNLEKIEAGLKTASDGVAAIGPAIDEVAGEIDELKKQLTGNDDAQARLDQIGDSLAAIGADATAKAKALKDIIPEPETPPEEPDTQELPAVG